MYKKILLAVDGSEHSMRATEEAIKMVQEAAGDVQLELVNAIQDVRSSEIVLQHIQDDDVRRNGEVRIQPNEDKLKNAKIDYTRTVEHGDPGKLIAKKANNGNFDLVIIGTRGLNSFQKMVVGSVSTEVIKKANCPVLVVK